MVCDVLVLCPDTALVHKTSSSLLLLFRHVYESTQFFGIAELLEILGR